MEHKYTNSLINESSPYLLQHAHNPVNWYAWGEEALQKAKNENKMIIISIGYSACHWCHVMEHESFEDASVAKVMNENFVCIKVDREERPDVDQIYMYAAYIVNGSGGWPLNALAMPDGSPFYAATYFPKVQWLQMLSFYIDIYKKKPEELRIQAENIKNNINDFDNVPFSDLSRRFELKDADIVFGEMKIEFDFESGGTKRAPKFPMPSNWDYLLHYHYLSKNNIALEAVNSTLENMAKGGIFDHLAGGFARYSTDTEWLVPHFEKMLYDNAQLVSLYSNAFRLTKNPLYKKTVYKILQFIENEMTSPENGFYSAIDADSEGEEGKFYVWTKTEIKNILGQDSDLFCEFYNISETGNWEHGKNILHITQSQELIAEKYNIPVAKFNEIIEKCTQKLLNIRSQRVRPGLDDKILSSWNALMISGYINAYRTFAEDKFLFAAKANADFLLKNCIGKDFSMTRNYKNGKSSIHAFLDDYAFTASAFIDLYQATFDENYLNTAKNLTDYTLEHFFDKNSGMFFYTHNQHSDLIARKFEISDNVIPSSNSETAKNLFLLGNFFAENDYIEKAKQMLTNVHESVQKNMYFHSNWGKLELNFASKFYEIAITGNDYERIRKEFDEFYLPNALFLGGDKENSLKLLENKSVTNQTTIFVCYEKTCGLPVKTVKEAILQII